MSLTVIVHCTDLKCLLVVPAAYVYCTSLTFICWWSSFNCFVTCHHCHERHWVCCCSLHRPVTVIGRGYGAAHQLVDYVIVSDCEIQNIIVSRIHARVVRSGSTYCIHDDSRNGVFINNVKIAGLYKHCDGSIF